MMLVFGLGIGFGVQNLTLLYDISVMSLICDFLQRLSMTIKYLTFHMPRNEILYQADFVGSF